jgi:hypothetical protein
MNKKGQFYLIMAMILIVVISGLLALSNYSKTSPKKNLDEMRKELDLEGEKILEYIAYTGDDKMEEFTKDYAEYVGAGAEIYFISGEPGLIEAYKYVDGVPELETVVQTEDWAKINIDNEDYEFVIKNGMNFHFVILKKEGGEKYVYESK